MKRTGPAALILFVAVFALIWYVIEQHIEFELIAIDGVEQQYSTGAGQATAQSVIDRFRLDVLAPRQTELVYAAVGGLAAAIVMVVVAGDETPPDPLAGRSI